MAYKKIISQTYRDIYALAFARELVFKVINRRNIKLEYFANAYTHSDTNPTVLFSRKFAIGTKY